MLGLGVELCLLLYFLDVRFVVLFFPICAALFFHHILPKPKAARTPGSS